MKTERVRAAGLKAVGVLLLGGISLLAALLPALLLACGSRNRTGVPDPLPLELAGLDGLRIAATFYPVKTPNPPGLLLLHGLGSDSGAWTVFAQRAQQMGYACLAFDLRGHGHSIDLGGQRLSYKSFKEDDWQRASRDIGVAWTALREHGANPADCALVGVSLGANLALAYAVEHEDVPSVVLISPGLDYKGIKTESAIVALGQRPVLLIAAKDDTYSASTCETLKKTATGLCELRMYAGSANGMDLIDAQNIVREDIFLWLRPIIGQNLPPLE